MLSATHLRTCVTQPRKATTTLIFFSMVQEEIIKKEKNLKLLSHLLEYDGHTIIHVVDRNDI